MIVHNHTCLIIDNQTTLHMYDRADDRSMHSTRIEQTALAVIDVLVQYDKFTAPIGQVLTTLGTQALGQPVAVGSSEYKSISLAVLYLEDAGFIQVDRAYRDEPHKANIILAIQVL